VVAAIGAGGAGSKLTAAPLIGARANDATPRTALRLVRAHRGPCCIWNRPVGHQPAPKPKRKPGRQKGDASPKAEVERQENIKEAMEYRLMGYTYRQIAEEMNVAPSTAHKWVSAGLADIPRETAEELRTMMMEQCNTIMPKLMPLMDETAPKDILDGILKVQAQQMKLAGMLQGSGISLSFGTGDGSGDSDEDIVVRIKADAPVLRPDEPVPANPVL